MRRYLIALIALLVTLHGTHLAAQSNWQSRVTESMPLMGHRNWILIVDSAYPLQSSPGVETIETSAGAAISANTQPTRPAKQEISKLSVNS